MNAVLPALAALRPTHWLKNAPVLAGIVFGRRIGDGTAVRSVALAFAAFCLVASAGYLVNDLVDRDVDRAHPRKCRRPIASGALAPRAAVALAVGLALAAAMLARAVPASARLCLAAYAVVSLAYTLGLRRVPTMGALAVAAGFVLRAAAGAYAAVVSPSPWLLSLTGVLALALVVSKREAEERRRRTEAPSALRRTTDALLLASALGYVAYGFAPDTVSLHGTRWLPLTALPVVAAILRYRRRLRTSSDGQGPAELVAADPLLVVLGAAWAATSVAVLAAH